MATSGSLTLTGDEPRQLKAGGDKYLRELDALKSKNEKLDKAFEVKKNIAERAKIEQLIESIKGGVNSLSGEELAFIVVFAELYEVQVMAARGTMKGLRHEKIAVDLLEEGHVFQRKTIPKVREAAGLPAKEDKPDDGQQDWTKEPGFKPPTAAKATKKTAKKATKKATKRRRRAVK